MQNLTKGDIMKKILLILTAFLLLCACSRKSAEVAVSKYAKTLDYTHDVENTRVEITTKKTVIICKHYFINPISDEDAEELKNAGSAQLGPSLYEALLKMQTECSEVTALVYEYINNGETIAAFGAQSEHREEVASFSEGVTDAYYPLLSSDEAELKITSRSNALVYKYKLKSPISSFEEMISKRGLNAYKELLVMRAECGYIDAIVCDFFSPEGEYLGDITALSYYDDLMVQAFVEIQKEEYDGDWQIDDNVRMEIEARDTSFVYKYIHKNKPDTSNLDKHELKAELEEWLTDMQKSCPEVSSVVYEYYTEDGTLHFSQSSD